ncbi:hypothetical protein E2C01_079511 [Portunus trituberculatus]|uniref:Uncharacterized protein n=1 Tax=Portunus trituberculatus TaxID=210409 RepID=A0A5B7IQT5_PORTR|nr:hypothetical protein [Portunus trituberculatus]
MKTDCPLLPSVGGSNEFAHSWLSQCQKFLLDPCHALTKPSLTRPCSAIQRTHTDTQLGGLEVQTLTQDEKRNDGVWGGGEDEAAPLHEGEVWQRGSCECVSVCHWSGELKVKLERRTTVPCLCSLGLPRLRTAVEERRPGYVSIICRTW